MSIIDTWRTRQALLSLIFLSKSITVTKEMKKENVKKYNYSVKALVVNGTLLEKRNSDYKLFSPGECGN